MSFVHSYPSTIHTSFLLNQVVQTEERYGIPREVVIFVNTDPRIAGEAGVEKAEGAKGVILKLANGITVIGPNAGYCFSLIKSKIETLYTYEGLEKGSQFRSRDLYPPVIAYLMDYLEDEMDLSEGDRGLVPDYRGVHVAHVDNYGNIKTTIKHSDFKGKYEYGDEVTVEAIVKKALEQNADAVESFKKGKGSAMGAIVGWIMKETKGQANPAKVQEILKKHLQ
jgi:S-adenosylmethionine hydrolase